MEICNRDPPVTQDDFYWNDQVKTGTGQSTALFLPSGFAWYFDADGEKRIELTKYGWTGLHIFVDDCGIDDVTLQYGINGLPTIHDLEPVVDQLRKPTEYDRIGSLFDISDEEKPIGYPAAWLWVNGEAWYFDNDGNPLQATEELGWQGLHRYLDQCNVRETEIQFRLAATIEDTSVAEPDSAMVVRDMLQSLE